MKASAAGSIVSLTAVTAGVAFVEVTATNDAGSVSQWIGVVAAAAAEGDDDAANEAAPSDSGAARDGDEAAVESGVDSSPLAIAVEVSDAAGETASATVIVQTASGSFGVDNGDGTLTMWVDVPGIAQPGHTYVLGTPTAWTRVTLAPSLALQFEQLDLEGIAHFADRELGWEVRLDWVTGSEVGRTTGVVPETNPAILRTEVIRPSTEMSAAS